MWHISAILSEHRLFYTESIIRNLLPNFKDKILSGIINGKVENNL